MSSTKGIPRSRDKLLAIVGVWAVAVAKPMLDVVGVAPEYWPANRIETGTVVTFAFVLALLPPALLGGVIVALKGGRRVRVASSLFFSTVFAFLLSLAIYHSLSLVLGKPVALIPASLAVASLVTLFYWRFTVIRVFFSYYSVMALLVPVMFLFFSPTRNLLGGSETTAAGGVEESQVTLKAPVVVVVFDELSLASLVNSEGDIDARLFPNFSRLSSISTWYQNATTNYGTTERSVPSLLTGRLQTGEAAGISYKQNPRNLFTLIHAPDGVHAVEPMTRLCPPELCGARSRNLSETFGRIVADFWLIYQNIIVPDRYASRIRSIPQRLRDLARVDVVKKAAEKELSDTVLIEKNFADWFQEGHDESLVFIHFMVPHVPYSRNPDGTAYSKLTDYHMIGWNIKDLLRWDKRSPFYATQAFQRYLLQLMYVDKLIGGILNTLEENGLLLESTLIVSSDHGVAFTPGYSRRSSTLRPAIIGAQNAVPVFWKSSGQATGTRSIRNVELIDVLPTLLDELGDGTGTREMDGQSILSTKEREEKIFGGSRYDNNVWPEVLLTSKKIYSEVNITEKSDGSIFVRPTEYSDFVGRPIDGALISEHTVKVKNPSIFGELASFDESSAFRPNFIEGWLEEESTVDALGVAINGLIADVVDIYVDEFGKRRFSSVFDPSILKLRNNKLDFVGLELLPSGEAVLSVLQSSRNDFHLNDGALVDATGRHLSKDDKRLVGSFDTLACSNSEMLHLVGWLGDKKTWEPPLAYLLVYKGLEVQGRVSLFRSDMVGVEGLKHSGFDTHLRFSGESCKPEDFRMFVIFDEETYVEMKNVLGIQPKQTKQTQPKQTKQTQPKQTRPLDGSEDFYIKGSRLMNAQSDFLKRDQKRLVGAFDTLGCSTPGLLHIKGWLGDRTTQRPPDAYLVVYQGEKQLLRPSLARPDLVAQNLDGLGHSGFDTYLRSTEESCNPEDFRMFVIFDEKTYAEMKFIIFDEETYAEMKNVRGIQPKQTQPLDGSEDFHITDGRLMNAQSDFLKHDQNRLFGSFDTLGCSTPELLHIKGWLGDRTTRKPPYAYLVVYQGEKQLLRPSLTRPDLVDQNLDGLAHSGFDTYLRFTEESCNPEDFRMFVIFDEETYAEMKNVLGFQSHKTQVRQ